MIHYHGTPTGGPMETAARFLAGRHALVPFSRPDDIASVAEVCASFVLDNGAFTTWKRNKPFDFDAYIDWCQVWARHPGCDWALIPDVIDGTEAENDAWIDAWPRELRGVPVWHMHESLDRLAHLATDWQTVALGSSGQWPTPGTRGWWERMAKAMAAVCDEHGRPRCRLHGLRMLDPAIFHRLPLSSADSTNAVRNSSSSNKRVYMPPSPWVAADIIARRIEAHNSASAWVENKQILLFEELEL